MFIPVVAFVVFIPVVAAVVVVVVVVARAVTITVTRSSSTSKATAAAFLKAAFCFSPKVATVKPGTKYTMRISYGESFTYAAVVVAVVLVDVVVLVVLAVLAVLAIVVVVVVVFVAVLLGAASTSDIKSAALVSDSFTVLELHASSPYVVHFSVSFGMAIPPNAVALHSPHVPPGNMPAHGSCSAPPAEHRWKWKAQ